jgi:hypothetical protein
MVQIATSKNIQLPGASIQDQLTLARVSVLSTRMKSDILCNDRIKTVYESWEKFRKEE